MMDIDSVFHNRFGAESLSRMSAVLHRGYYKVFLFFLQYINHLSSYLITNLTHIVDIFLVSQNTNRDQFPYERQPKSNAYIPTDEGDYYYTAAVWGGYVEDMYKLVK